MAGEEFDYGFGQTNDTAGSPSDASLYSGAVNLENMVSSPTYLQGLMPGGIGANIGPLLSLLGIPMGLGSLLFNQNQTNTPRPTPQALQALAGQQGALQGAQGMQGGMAPQQMGLYNQSAGLLGGMMNGQMPQGFTNLIQNAYQPYVSSITGQAIDAARNRGFAGSGEQDFADGGPASQVAAPALANLPGMEANTALNMWQQLAQQGLQQGQQGFQNQMGIGQQYGQTGTGLQGGWQQQVPLGTQLSNAGSIMGAFNQIGSSLPGGALYQWGQNQNNMQGFQGGRGY